MSTVSSYEIEIQVYHSLRVFHGQEFSIEDLTEDVKNALFSRHPAYVSVDAVVLSEIERLAKIGVVIKTSTGFYRER